MKTITLAHGAGGKITQNLIKDIFLKYFNNDFLQRLDDSASIDLSSKKIAFTTDSFVVKPLFFPGGDIGKLSICGTVNDLLSNGAVPGFVSCGLIIEEGFAVEDLERIVKSMAVCAREAGVKIVTGDTKVVGNADADQIFINTSGVGVIENNMDVRVENIKPTDKVIINGAIAEHGLAVLAKRKGLEFENTIKSDCAPLSCMIKELYEFADAIKFMRDPSRGGVANTLNEITQNADFGIALFENDIVVSDQVRGACELLGLDPLYIANEGKMLIIVKENAADDIVKILRNNIYGRQAAVIGEVNSDTPGKVCVKTQYGVDRIVDMLAADALPRIC